MTWFTNFGRVPRDVAPLDLNIANLSNSSSMGISPKRIGLVVGGVVGFVPFDSQLMSFSRAIARLARRISSMMKACDPPSPIILMMSDLARTNMSNILRISGHGIIIKNGYDHAVVPSLEYCSIEGGFLIVPSIGSSTMKW